MAELSTPPHIIELLRKVRDRAEAAGVFARVTLEGARLACEAKDAASPAEYRLELDSEGDVGGRLWVALVTPDRWLSQSIEADLVHTGDKLEELIEEELVDQGYTAGRLPFEHFRSRDMLFTFRSPLPIAGEEAGTEAAATLATQCLLAYEACFRRLGDMEGGDEE